MLTPTSDGFGDCGGRPTAVTVIWLIIAPLRGFGTTWVHWRGSQLHVVLLHIIMLNLFYALFELVNAQVRHGALIMKQKQDGSLENREMDI